MSLKKKGIILNFIFKMIHVVGCHQQILFYGQSSFAREHIILVCNNSLGFLPLSISFQILLLPICFY